jgi:hypothetical protein
MPPGAEIIIAQGQGRQIKVCGSILIRKREQFLLPDIALMYRILGYIIQ